MKLYALRDKKTGKFKRKGQTKAQSKFPTNLYTKGQAESILKKKNNERVYKHPDGSQKGELLFDYELYEVEI